MNTNLVRAHSKLDGWPILLVYAAYVILFAIVASTMTSVFLVA